MRLAPWMLSAVLAVLASCAPTTLSPMAVRLAPGSPTQVTPRTGVRTGPRLSVPLQDPEHFKGNRNPFSSPQWAVAYDADLLVPVGGGTGLHVGLQGEIGCDDSAGACAVVPVPGYGLTLGMSHYLQLGDVSLAPAVMLRGATDFGIATEGGPGSILGVEASASLALRMDKTVVGLVPFIGVHRVIMSERSVSATYGGVALAGHFELDGEFIEVTAGTGLVRMRGVEDWWAPIFGVRGGP